MRDLADHEGGRDDPEVALWRAAARMGPAADRKLKMTGMKIGRSLIRSTAAVISLTLVAGCASAPPAPVTSIAPLVGKWAGTVAVGKGDVGKGGALEPFYLSINADQTLVATWGVNWSWGTITVANGQATYQMTPPPFEGTMRFYPDNGKPTLYLDDLFASFQAVVTRQ